MLHDFDYEVYPNAPDHPLKGSEILRERGYSEEFRRAILGHANYTGVARVTLLARVLYACDELTGFIVACALVRPNGIWDLESKSVKKELKDKAFARTVNRGLAYWSDRKKRPATPPVAPPSWPVPAVLAAGQNGAELPLKSR